MQYFQIFSSFLIFCCYFTRLKAREISFKIWETREIFPILHSAPYDNNYVSVFQLLMLVLLNTLSLSSKIFYLSSTFYHPFKFYWHLYCSKFLSVGATFTYCDMAKKKKKKKWKRKEKILLIPARLHASVKNIDPERIKIFPKDKDVKDNSIIITCLPLFKILIKIRYHPSWN